MAGMDKIKHLVVLMMENRSLDNLLGYAYADVDNKAPEVIPTGSSPLYDGLSYFDPRDPKNPFWNPTDAAFFKGGPSGKIFASREAENYVVPNPDPEEDFADMTYQIFGPQPVAPTTPNQMKGFYLNYGKVSKTPEQIMQCYSPSQKSVLNALARTYAVSDQWFASSPTQTWPNRSFVHTGTSNGRVNNWPYDPFDYNIPTIFNTLERGGISWKVYNDTILESLTRLQLPHLWDPLLEDHFHGFDRFKEDAKNGTLPSYTFLEPSFQIEPNDDHPPHDVLKGEAFMFDCWYALLTGKNWSQTLFLITYDEHGGCYDHTPPLFSAKTPDQKSDPGQDGFTFNRFGVRVPTVLISPYVEGGTVFRTQKTSPYTPYDHTSVLATLQKWLNIPSAAMPQSARTEAAPKFDGVLSLATPREDTPDITRPDISKAAEVPDDAPPNDLQLSLVVAAAAKQEGQSLVKDRVQGLVSEMKTRADVTAFLMENAKRKN